MWRCPSFVLILTSLLWLEVEPSHAYSFVSTPAAASEQLAQGGVETLPTIPTTTSTAIPTVTPNPTATQTATPPLPTTDNLPILRLGDSGESVKELQSQLTQLGYYEGKIDGEFGTSTRLAVAKFQAAKGLSSDGVVGGSTRIRIEAEIQARAAAIATPSPDPAKQQKSQKRGLLWWVFVGMGLFGCVGAAAYAVRKYKAQKPKPDPTVIIPDEVSAIATDGNLTDDNLSVDFSTNGQPLSSEGISFRNITPEVVSGEKKNQNTHHPTIINATIVDAESERKSQLVSSQQKLLPEKLSEKLPEKLPEELPENNSATNNPTTNTYINNYPDHPEKKPAIASEDSQVNFVSAIHNEATFIQEKNCQEKNYQEKTYIQTQTDAHYTSLSEQEQTFIEHESYHSSTSNHEQTFIQHEAYYSSTSDHEQTFIQEYPQTEEYNHIEEDYPIEENQIDVGTEPWSKNAASQIISDQIIPEQTISGFSPHQSPSSFQATSQEFIAPEIAGKLTKVNIIDELVSDLRSPDPNKRRKAIWDLGQQGDSRAIQPLVDLLIDADSQQRSLILGALSEIGTRTLKPMNRALAISLQDESPEVRQNAIRDLTRVYDMMTQLSQMLYHATEDPDPNVQATARYALSQFNRLRSLAKSEDI